MQSNEFQILLQNIQNVENFTIPFMFSIVTQYTSWLRLPIGPITGADVRYRTQSHVFLFIPMIRMGIQCVLSNISGLLKDLHVDILFRCTAKNDFL